MVANGKIPNSWVRDKYLTREANSRKENSDG